MFYFHFMLHVYRRFYTIFSVDIKWKRNLCLKYSIPVHVSIRKIINIFVLLCQKKMEAYVCPFDIKTSDLNDRITAVQESCRNRITNLKKKIVGIFFIILTKLPFFTYDWCLVLKKLNIKPAAVILQCNFSHSKDFL